MKIILLKDMNNVGDKHEVVEVKNGYGRNYLIPQGLAVIANPTNMAKLDALKAEEEAKEAARLEEYKEMAAQLEGKSLEIGVKAGASGKIFGSVTALQISQALADQLNVEVPRKKIELQDDVKEVGDYTATLNLHKDVTTTIGFTLKAE